MKFTLGTAQLGMNYGFVNRAGKPPRPQAVAMVLRAVAEGVATLDTARDYGDAEEVLGEALAEIPLPSLKIVTKLDPLTSLSPNATKHCVKAAVDKSVSRSCQALKTERLDTLLLHRWDHYRARDGTIWERLLELQQQGKIGTLGASIYEPAEALEALQDSNIRHLQIPMNVLDWRWKAAGVDLAAARRPDVEIHGRSALLQGVLAHPVTDWPLVAGFDAVSCVDHLGRLASRFERESIPDLCLAYARSQGWISSVVVGCESLVQLTEDLRLFRHPKLFAAQCEELERTLPRTPEDLLNPAKWKISHEPAGAAPG